MTRASVFSLATLWLVLALVALPCSGARAALDRQDPADQGRAEAGQLGPLLLQDGLIFTQDGNNSGSEKSGSGINRPEAESGAAHTKKTKHGSSTTTTVTAAAADTPRRNVLRGSQHDRNDNHPRPLHRHNDHFEPALERRGSGGGGRRDRQKSTPVVAADDLQGGLHIIQDEDTGATSRHLRGGGGGARG